MPQVLILCRSLTHAQRSARLLERKGIFSAVVKAPQGLSSRGCTYALSLRKKVGEAVDILKKNDMLTGKLYRQNGEEYVEVEYDIP